MQDGREKQLRWLLVAGLVISAILLAVGSQPWHKLLAGLSLTVVAVALVMLHGRRVVDAPAVSELSHTARQLSQTVQERDAALVVAGENLKDESLERSWTTHSLEHQLRYANTIINAIGEPLMVVSKALNITRINPALLRATGFAESDVIAQPLSKILRVAFESMELKNDPLPPALKEGRELTDRTAYLVNKAGTITPVLMSLFPVRDQDKVVGGILLLRDASKAPAKTAKSAAARI